jgi:uncharacterized protein YrrD
MDTSFPPSLLKSDLLTRLALNLDTAEEFGPITEVWVNGRTHQVQGLGCSTGLLGRQNRRFLWSQVASVGHDGLILKAGAQAVATDEPPPDCLALGELELWSDHGDRVGQLTDYRFDPANGNILQYRFIAGESSPLAPGLYALDPLAVISMGRRRMMAEAASLSAATLLEAEVPHPQTPSPGRPSLNPLPFDQVPDPRRSWDAAVETTRHAREQVAEQVSERRQQFQSQAQNRFGNLLGDVKKRTRRLRNQLRETVTDVTAGLPSGQHLHNDNIPTIDVDAMELWAEEEEPRRSDER